MAETKQTSQTNGFCKYKDIFGKPNDGLHRYRIFDIAIVDTVFTIIFVYVFTYFTKYSFWLTLAVTFFVGIFAHRLFCVRTRIDKILFPEDSKK